MGIFSFKGEQHGHECLDRHGTWWAKPNPMGWGSNEPRVVKRANEDARLLDRGPKMHGTTAEYRLMSGVGSLIRLSGDHVQVTGEKPGRQRR